MSADMSLRTKEETQSGIGKSVLRIVFGFSLALIFTLVGLAVLAAIVYFGDVSEKWMAPIVSVISLLSLYFGTKLSLKSVPGAFWRGVAVGALYYAFCALIGLLLSAGGRFSVRAVFLMVIGMLVSGVGALTVHNTSTKKRKRKNKRK